LTAANIPLIAQYAPRYQNQLKIAVLMIKKATESTLTSLALAGSHLVNRAAANFYFIRI